MAASLWAQAALAADAPQTGSGAAPPPVLPDLTLQMLVPGADELVQQPLRALEGGHPRVVAYVLAGQEASQLELRRLAALAGELGDALTVTVIMPPKPGVKTVAELKAMLTGAQALELPLLRDDGMKVGAAMKLAAAPSLVILDADGRQHLAGARSLAHRLVDGGTVEDALRALTAGKPIAPDAELVPFRPAERLLGSPLLPFALDGVGGEPVQVGASGTPDKATLLVFWSVRCPHCTQTMPELARVARELSDRVSTVTVARAPDAAYERETRDYLRKQGIELASALDRSGEVSRGYLVVSTPTLVLAKPGGAIVGVKAGHVDDLEGWIEGAL